MLYSALSLVCLTYYTYTCEICFILYWPEDFQGEFFYTIRQFTRWCFVGSVTVDVVGYISSTSAANHALETDYKHSL